MMLVRRCYQLLHVFLANEHLSPVSRQSRLSDNDKGNNQVKPGVMHRSHGIYLMAEKTPENQG